MKQLFITLFLMYVICAHTQSLPGPGNQYHHYVWATYNFHKGDLRTSYESFRSLFAMRPSLYAYVGYVPLLFVMEQHAAITSIINHIDHMVKDHVETQLLFARSLELNGNTTAAHTKSIELAQLFPHNPEVAYQLIRTYIMQQNYQEALQVAQSYVTNTLYSPAHYLFYYVQAQAYAALNQLLNAEQCAKTSIQFNHRFEQSWLLLGLIYELSNKEDQALSVYNEYLSKVGPSKIISEQKRNVGKTSKHNISHNNDRVSSSIQSIPVTLYAP